VDQPTAVAAELQPDPAAVGVLDGALLVARLMRAARVPLVVELLH
jgi:hypothetical protein